MVKSGAAEASRNPGEAWILVGRRHIRLPHLEVYLENGLQESTGVDSGQVNGGGGVSVGKRGRWA